MKKYGIIGLIAVAVAAIGLAGWHFLRGRDDSMASSLPQELTMVGRMDAKTLVQDYGLDFAELKKRFFTGKDEEKTGIKLQATAYAFASQGHLGAIVALDDEEDFEAYLKKQGIETEEQRGMKWAVVNGNVLMGFNKDRVMMMGPAVGNERDALRNTIYSCMNQRASESGKESRLYRLLEKRKEPVAMVGTLEALPADLLKEYTKYLNVPIENVDLSAGLTVHKERMTLALGLQSDDQATDKQLRQMGDLLDDIDGDLDKTMPTGAVFHLVMGLDGEDLLKRLRENRLMRTALLAMNMVMDLDMVLQSIDGDVALSCLDAETPQLLFQAKLDNDKFMKKVGGWNDATAQAMGFSFYTQDKNTAVCLYQGTPIYFGTNNKRLAISNSEALVRAAAHTDAKWKLASEMKGKCLFATVDIQRLLPLLADASPQDGLMRWVSRFDRLTLSVGSLHEMCLELVAPEGSDILKVEN